MTDPKAVDMAGPEDELPITGLRRRGLRQRGVRLWPVNGRSEADLLIGSSTAYATPREVIPPARRCRLSRLLRRLGVGR